MNRINEKDYDLSTLEGRYKVFGLDNSTEQYIIPVNELEKYRKYI